MGYTSYWRKTATIPCNAWSKIIADTLKVYNHPSVNSLIQQDNDVPSQPIANANLICFNGIGENGHESFYFKKDFDNESLRYSGNNRDFGFCKTARKPYDVVVTAILWIVVKHTTHVKVTADGGFQDFLPGLRLAEACGVDFPQRIVHRMLRTLDPACLMEGYKLEGVEVNLPANQWYLRKPTWQI